MKIFIRVLTAIVLLAAIVIIAGCTEPSQPLSPPAVPDVGNTANYSENVSENALIDTTEKSEKEDIQDEEPQKEELPESNIEETDAKDTQIATDSEDIKNETDAEVENMEEEMLPETIKATIIMENGGSIELELYPQIAPQSVFNFVYLAREGYYDGLIFHRVIETFMIQGGDPTGLGIGGPGYTIKGEFTKNGVTNPLHHTRGIISMARQGDPAYDSAGSQFFIVHQDSRFLDGSYAAFGKVISGLEVVDQIAQSPTDNRDRPLEDIVIKTITIDGPILPEPERIAE